MIPRSGEGTRSHRGSAPEYRLRQRPLDDEDATSSRLSALRSNGSMAEGSQRHSRATRKNIPSPRERRESCRGVEPLEKANHRHDALDFLLIAVIEVMI